MKEARIIIPTSADTAIWHTNKAFVKEFGGCTESFGNGFWTASNSKEITEPVCMLDVAYEPSDENDAKLYDIAYHVLYDGQQESVYLRYGNGHVQMITEMSCMDNGHGHFDVSLSGVLEAVNILTDSGQVLEDRLNAFEYLEQSLPKRKRAA